MATDTVVTNTVTGVDGTSYTSAVSNDTLTNEDFLQLLLEELKMQDPTSPMDSARMLDTQMQMSSIETNLSLVTAMESMQSSYAQAALSNAANVIGKSIEDGNISQSGTNKAYTVRSVENIDGAVYVKAQEILYLEDVVTDVNGDLLNYDVNGNILDSTGTQTGNKITLTDPGTVALDDDGNVIILDSEGEIVTQTDEYKFTYQGGVNPVYSDELTTIDFDSITKIF